MPVPSIQDQTGESKYAVAYGELYCRCLLQVHKEDSVSRISDILELGGFTPVAGIRFPSTSVFPTAVGMVCLEADLVFVSGTDDVRQVWNYVFSWNRSPDDKAQFATREWWLWGWLHHEWQNDPDLQVWPPFWVAGRALWKAIQDNRGGRNTPIILVGHSYGGAACVAAAMFARYTGQGEAIALFTYGQPKVSNEHGGKYLGDVRYVRFESIDDNVPMLPPGIADLPLPATKTGFTQKLVPRLFAHTTKPIMLGVGGLCNAWQIRFPLALSVIGDGIDAWVEAVSDDTAQAHRLPVYHMRLLLASVELDSPTLLFYSSPPPTPPPEPAAPMPETVPALVESQAGPANAQQPILVFVPSSGSPGVRLTVLDFRDIQFLLQKGKIMHLGFIPRDDLPRVRRLTATTYAVIWEGKTIAQSTSQGQMRTVVKNMTKFLRRMSSMQGNSISAISQAMSIFLGHAGSLVLAKPFNPIMNP